MTLAQFFVALHGGTFGEALVASMVEEPLIYRVAAGPA